MGSTQRHAEAKVSALDGLINREEVLQICFWRQGEGFGGVHDAKSIQPFLNRSAEAIDQALMELEAEGHLERTGGPIPGYSLTAKGMTSGGNLFADAFADSQRQGHGECPAGCCDGDDHSQCGDACALH